jgi:hypothetical protein
VVLEEQAIVFEAKERELILHLAKHVQQTLNPLSFKCFAPR